MPGQAGHDVISRHGRLRSAICNGVHRRAEEEIDSVHPAEQGVDNVHGVLRAGEYAVVVLEYQGDTGGLEPVPGVFLREDAQEALHEAFSAGIGLAEGADAFKGICQVATTAARDGDLGQGLGPGLVDIDLHGRESPSQLGGAETTGGTGSYDGDAFHLWEFPYSESSSGRTICLYWFLRLSQRSFAYCCMSVIVSFSSMISMPRMVSMMSSRVMMPWKQP